MLNTGDVLDFPDGTQYIITQSVADTAGETFEMEIVLPVAAEVIPPHIHPHQEEEYRVTSGTLDVLYDGNWRKIHSNDAILIPPGKVHTFKNASNAEVRLLNVHRPALSFPDYLEKIYHLLKTGKVSDLSSPSSVIYVSMLWKEHQDTIVAAQLPQKVVMNVMASIGKLLGHSTGG